MSRVIPPSNDAKNNIVAPKHETNVSEQDSYEHPDRVLKSHGDASQALDKLIFDKVAEHPYDEEKMAMLAFMNEDIEIRMGVSTDPNAEQIFELTINGKTELFRRGETKVVKRYFVDLLLRLKQTRWSHQEVINAQGDKDIVYQPHTAIKYDFAITRDLNPLGRDWQRAVLAEAG